MDITDTLAPASDQLDAIELAASGPRIFTITGVSRGSAEQPINIALAELDRPWRPGKSMRRVLAACWGTDASKYVGRRVTLFCEPNVMFGKDKVGGTRISHLSHIDKRQSVPLLVSRGKSAMYHVDPLPDEPTQHKPTAGDIAACADVATLRSWWQQSTPALRKAIEARVAELSAPVEGSAQDDDDHEADLAMLAAEAEAERDE